MGVSLLEQQNTEAQVDTYPLLMEPSENLTRSEHIIDMPRSSNDASSSNQSHDRISSVSDPLQGEERLPSTPELPVSQTSTFSSSRQNSRNGRRRRSPLNSGLWISIELVLTLGQIIAAIVVLSVSRNEHPRAPLFAWIVGYAIGCVASLPLLYWRYYHSNQASEQESGHHRPNLNVAAGPFAFSITRTAEGEGRQTNAMSPRSSRNAALMSARLKVLIEYFKMGLDCFFAIWFVVGNVWIFGGRSSASEAPNLYRLCIVFLSFSCVGYAMPFILCTTICCCLPCIISILGYREDLAQPRGATPESINALPTYKFKVKKSRNGDDSGSNSGTTEGGVVAAGTEKERVISGEDAVCCICLAKYANNDELRELPCSHFFHKDCLDKWLKINATCPLCKSEVGERTSGSTSASANPIGALRSLTGTQDHRHNDQRVNNNGSANSGLVSNGLANNVL